MEANGTFVCKTCGAGLFAAAEKMGVGGSTIAFRKPLGDDRIQSRKNKDGQWLVRCAQCHTHLGSAIGGKNPHYRIQTTQIDARGAVPEIPDMPAFAEKQVRAFDRHTDETPAILMGNAAIFGAGAAVGGILAATIAFLICRNLETPLSATNITPTSTALVVPPPPRPRPTPTPAPTPVRTPRPQSTSSPASTSTVI